MTTISHNKKQKKFSAPAVFAFALLCVVLAAAGIWRGAVAGMLWHVLAPVVSLRNALDATQNLQLRAALASTTAALADRNALYQENVMLKNLLGRSVTTGGVLAAVLMRPPGVPYDTLMLDAGKQQGIAVGDLVVAGGTAIVGSISDVYDTTSRVTLFSAPGETYQAILHLSAQANTTIPVSLEGQGAGSMSGEVPAGTPVTVGDTVMLSGIAESFVGTVSHVSAPSGVSFETIFVQLPVNMFSLQFVEIKTQP